MCLLLVLTQILSWTAVENSVWTRMAQAWYPTREQGTGKYVETCYFWLDYSPTQIQHGAVEASM